MNCVVEHISPWQISSTGKRCHCTSAAVAIQDWDIWPAETCWVPPSSRVNMGPAALDYQDIMASSCGARGAPVFAAVADRDGDLGRAAQWKQNEGTAVFLVTSARQEQKGTKRPCVWKRVGGGAKGGGATKKGGGYT